MGIIKNKEGQFMLLAGFIIGIGLVIVTVMLNNIIFEGNIAGEAASNPLKYDAVNLMQVTANEMRSAYTNATALGIDDEQNFSIQMQNFSAGIQKIYAVHGEGVNVSWDISNWNNTQPANFTKSGLAGGAPNWTVVEGVDANSLDSGGGVFKFWNMTFFPGPSFKIEARNSTGDTLWSVELDSSGYNIVNATNTSYNPYTSPDEIDSRYIDLYFPEGKPVSIHIINGNNAYGKFWIQGLANDKFFIRERHHTLNATLMLSTSRFRSNITIPVPVPW